jgi:EmrB/QacA subfamily drug resistance transporter
MEEKKADLSRYVVLFITMLSSFFTPFMASAVNIAMPVIGAEFNIDALTLGWIATSYLLSAAAFLVPFGKIADIYGRKKIFTTGIIIYSVSSLLSAFAPEVVTLIIARTIQGIGGSMIFGTAIAILTSVFPASERGKVIGYNLASTYLGLSLGPFIGGVLTHQFGWRSVFLLSFILSTILIPLIFWKLKGEWAEAKGEKFDFKGSVIYMVGLILIMYGFSILTTWQGMVVLACGIVAIILFFKMEHKIKYPVLDLSSFKHNTVFIFSNLAAFINYSATFAVGYLLSLYLQYIKGLSPQDAGIILVAQPITMAIFSPIAGRLSDKFEPQLVATAGMILTVAGLVPFIFLNDNTPTLYLVITLLVIGIGFALFSSPNTNAVMSSVERKYYGVASASLGTMRLTGQAISMGIASLIFAFFIGKVKITAETHAQFLLSTHTIFITFTVLCTIGVFASMARGRLRNKV